MISLYLITALALLVLGVVGSLLPSVPGPLFSVLGVLLYWWSTGYTTPGTWLVVFLVSAGVFASVIDLLATYFGARKSGTTKETAYAAVVAGFLLFFVTGFFGILLGVLGTIFVREYLQGKSSEEALKSSLVSGAALIGSTIFKFLLTLSIAFIFTVSILI